MGLFGNLFGTKNGAATSVNASKEFDQQLEKLGREAVDRYMNKVAAGLSEDGEDVDAIFEQYGKMFDAELEQKANNGDKYAQYVLGNKYAENEQYAKARIWFEKAADSGLADGYYELAGFELNGWGGQPVNKEKGLDYLRKAAEGGMLYVAADKLAEILSEMVGDPDSKKSRPAAIEAEKWYTICAVGAEKYNPEEYYYFCKGAYATHNLMATFYLLGNATQEIEDIAMMSYYFYNKTAKDSRAECTREELQQICFNLGRCGVQLNRSWAKYVLNRGAKAGSADCAKLLNLVIERDKLRR